MPRLHVCPLAHLAVTAKTTGAASLMTLLSPVGVVAVRPAGIKATRHLVIGVSDVVEWRDGCTPPEVAHVEAMLAFFQTWDRRAPLLIHCYAGVSRSTAAAFIGVCALAPGRDEGAIAAALRVASPTATPNARLVALADAVLGRGGRMREAIAAIGRGAECFEGAPFAMTIEGA